MRNFARFDEHVGKIIQEIKAEYKSEVLDRRVKALAQQCHREPTVLEYWLDQKKDHDVLKKDMSIRVLGEAKIDNPKIIDYLLDALKNKSNLEYHLGSHTPRNSLIIPVVTFASAAMLGFSLGGPVGMFLSVYGTKKFAEKIMIPYLGIDKIRREAAVSLRKIGNCTNNVIDALKARIEDPAEDSFVKEAAQEAIRHLTTNSSTIEDITSGSSQLSQRERILQNQQSFLVSLPSQSGTTSSLVPVNSSSSTLSS